MPHTVFHFASEYTKKPHVAKEMQPAAVKEHRCQKWHIINQRQAVHMGIGLYIFRRDNSKQHDKLVKHALRQGGLEIEDYSAERDKQPGCRRETPVW